MGIRKRRSGTGSREQEHSPETGNSSVVVVGGLAGVASRPTRWLLGRTQRSHRGPELSIGTLLR